MASWYVQSDGSSVGPLDRKGMEGLAASGRLSSDTLICRVGSTEWSRAEFDADIAGLIGSAGILPPPGPGMPVPPDWDIFGVAKYHRMFLYGILASIVVNIMAFASWIWQSSAGPANVTAALSGLAVLAATIGVAAILVAMNVLLQRAMRTNVALIVLSSVFLLAPCIGLITMLVISQTVQKRFRSLGVRVGFLGVSRRTLLSAGYVPRPGL